MTEFPRQNAGGPQERLETASQAQVLDGGACGIEVGQQCAKSGTPDEQAGTAPILDSQRPNGSGDDSHQPNSADAQGNVSWSSHAAIFMAVVLMSVVIGDSPLALLPPSYSRLISVARISA